MSQRQTPLPGLTSEEIPERISEILACIRRDAPVIQCLTNYVSMNIMANVLLSLGASPAMVHAEEEVADFVTISSALVINIGTLSAPWVRSMELAVEKAEALGKPWVLDPVGCGATPYRTRVSQHLGSRHPTLIRGNASEIMALGDVKSKGVSKGIDASHATTDAEVCAYDLAQRLRTVIAVSGSQDFVTNGTYSARSSYGTPLMTKVTALGCSLNGVMAAFLTACSSPIEAAYLAFVAYGVAGEKAAACASGPGRFSMEFLDSLHTLSRDDIQRAFGEQ